MCIFIEIFQVIAIRITASPRMNSGPFAENELTGVPNHKLLGYGESSGYPAQRKIGSGAL
jgi:hypothetical protein